MNFSPKNTKFLATLFILASNFVYSQDYNRVRLTAGVGLAPLVFIEPSFRINDQFSVGVKWEKNYPSFFVLEDRASWAITSQWYFTKEESIRPFIGLGIGYYYFGEFLSPNSYTCDMIYNKSQTGFFPRIGFDTRRLTVALDLNLIGSISYIQRCFSSGRKPIEQSETKNYLTVKAGFSIGGEKKENQEENMLKRIKKFFKKR